MDVGFYFLWVEQSGLSKWIRESPSLLAFPGILFLHTLGMGFLAGTNMAMDLRILGVAPRIPLAPMEQFYRVMWSAFCLSAVSGVLLLIAYPTKALTNPLFYVKLTLIALAVGNMRLLRKQVFGELNPDARPVPRKSKILAGTSLVFWVAIITTGRLLAYTFSRMYWNG